MSSIKPIKIYGKGGPNPPKVAFVVKELDLPHEIVDTQFSELKGEDFLKINPNGRMPAIHDPNTDLTLWESGAIIQYLVDRYDKDNKLSFKAGSNEAYLANQWLMFQMSGQGPYFGQAVWFTRFHSEQLPSAQERYQKEINRVTSVLEGHLAKQEKGSDGPWLVGGKFSYADLAFLPWQLLANMFAESKAYVEADYPHVKDWVRRIAHRPAIKSVLEADERFKNFIPKDE